MIKAILWDLDGVLIESEEIIYKRWATTYKELGFTLPQAVFSKNIGKRPDEVFRATNEELGIDMKLTFEEAYEIHRKNRGENPGVPLVPYVKTILKQLHRNYKMAVVTSSSMSWLTRMLKPIQYKKYFEAFITGADITNPKPHPEPYLKGLEKLGVSAGEAVVIEDAPSGIISAKKAGTTVIARRAKHNKQHDLSLSDYLVEDMREIPKIIKTL